jgi:1,4-alpha-glucan branching enzyme
MVGFLEGINLHPCQEFSFQADPANPLLFHLRFASHFPSSSSDMNHQHDHGSSHTEPTHSSSVQFKFTSPSAISVSVAGSFNGWRPDTKHLHRVPGGQWLIEVPLQAGVYEYRFVVDGAWTDDPHSTETVANPFGGRNAVVKVAPAPPAAAASKRRKT